MSRFGTFGLGGATIAAGFALYMISYNVAAQRDAIEALDRRIAADTAEVETMEAELGVLTSLSRLEAWNGAVWNMRSPRPSQILEGTRHFAAFAAAVAPRPTDEPRVLLASAPAAAPESVAATLATAAPKAETAPRPAVLHEAPRRTAPPRIVLASAEPVRIVPTPPLAVPARTSDDPFSGGFDSAMGGGDADFETASFRRVSLR